MSSVNFSNLQSTTNAASGSQLFLRLDNGLSGSDGFRRINVSNFEKSLTVYSAVTSSSANWNTAYNFVQNGGTVGGNVTINGTLSANFIRAASANIDIINITNYELSGFSILSGGLTVQGTISSNNIVYASGGNSNQWNSAFTTVQNSSGNWDGVNSLSATVWVDKLGNDSTGEIGNIQKPYLTMQAAYNAGAKMFHVGAGTFGGISTSSDINIAYTGVGLNRTVINNIGTINDVTNYYSVNLQDIGKQSATIENIGSIGVDSTDPSVQGGHGGIITLTNVAASYVSNKGGDGANGTISQPDGSQGGNAYTININGDCYAYSIQNYGGNGGNASSGGSGIGGNGGSSSGISGDTLNCISIINCYGGDSGSNDGSNSTATNGGAAGSISLKNLHCSGNVNIDAGVGGGVSPPGVAAGILTLNKAYISQLDASPSNGGGDGVINGQFIYIDTVNGSTTINAVVSYIGGVPYGT